MTEAEAIRLFKCLSDKSRLQILKSLAIEDKVFDDVQLAPVGRAYLSFRHGARLPSL